MKRRLGGALVLLVGLVTLAACAPNDEVASTLASTSWILTDVPTPVIGHEPTISFVSARRFSGHDGCNDWSGTYRVVDGVLQVDNFGSEDGGCPTETVQETAEGFIDLLLAEPDLTLAGDELVIESAGTRLAFGPSNR